MNTSKIINPDPQNEKQNNRLALPKNVSVHSK